MIERKHRLYKCALFGVTRVWTYYSARSGKCKCYIQYVCCYCIYIAVCTFTSKHSNIPGKCSNFQCRLLSSFQNNNHKFYNNLKSSVLRKGLSTCLFFWTTIHFWWWLKYRAETCSKTEYKAIYNIYMVFFKFKVCKSVHHRTIQINHEPDATIFQFIILTFVYSSTCFGHFPAHHQELSDCSGSLWFYLRIVVTVVLCSWSFISHTHVHILIKSYMFRIK